MYRPLVYRELLLLTYFLHLYCPSGISPMENSGCLPPEKASCDRVALPILRYVLGILVFPLSIKL